MKAFEDLKRSITTTPVLRYYNLKEEVTLQCDASQTGLGAALLQNGQPVAYYSRALTDAETRYAQIEKELLAIVFACDRFDAYTFGRYVVHVESDHQPLEMIMQKPLSAAPKRLQRMLAKTCPEMTHAGVAGSPLVSVTETACGQFLPVPGLLCRSSLHTHRPY